jgi:hypothetical protein
MIIGANIILHSIGNYLQKCYFCKLFVVLAVYFCSSLPVFGEILFSETSDIALYQILNLKTKSAQKIIDASRKQNPEDIYLEYLENWKEVIELIGYEDQDNYDVYVKSFDKRLEHIESWEFKEFESFNITLAEIYAHAGLANVMYGDYLAGFRKFLRANKLSMKNLMEYPDYWPNYKLCGALNVSLDQMPTILKWLTSLLGLKGNSEEGLKQIDTYLAMVQNYPGLKSEALVYKVFTMKMKKDEEGAYRMLEKELGNETPPTLLKYLQANIMYITSRNEEALSLLQSFPRGYTEVPFYHVDYLKGKSKMNKLESDANTHMIRFLEGSKFKNYKREIYNKLSCYYLINGNIQKYNHYKNQIDDCAKATSDRDREANIESKRPYMPHPELLKARFLLNGGYTERARIILDGVSVNSLSIPAYLTEYYLLSARALSGSGDFSIVKHYCDLAISTGKDQEEHYASEAALLAGDMAYRSGNTELARKYWKMTFEVYNVKDVYVENIQKKAKYKLKDINAKS